MTWEISFDRTKGRPRAVLVPETHRAARGRPVACRSYGRLTPARTSGCELRGSSSPSVYREVGSAAMPAPPYAHPIGVSLGDMVPPERIGERARELERL